jgi:hypothetical protein
VQVLRQSRPKLRCQYAKFTARFPVAGVAAANAYLRARSDEELENIHHVIDGEAQASADAVQAARQSATPQADPVAQAPTPQQASPEPSAEELQAQYLLASFISALQESTWPAANAYLLTQAAAAPEILIALARVATAEQTPMPAASRKAVSRNPLCSSRLGGGR